MIYDNWSCCIRVDSSWLRLDTALCEPESSSWQDLKRWPTLWPGQQERGRQGSKCRLQRSRESASQGGQPPSKIKSEIAT